jgi:N-ethylmaleimide reductase
MAGEDGVVYGLSSRNNSKVSGYAYDDLRTARTLLSPYSFRDLEVRNRVVMAPMTRSRAGAERMPNKLMTEHYLQRADAGLIVTEAVNISEQAIGWLNTPGIYTDAQAEAWKQVLEPVQALGTPMFIQLWHMGRASHPSFRKDRSMPVAPSAVAINSSHRHTPEGTQPYPVPRALETSEIGGVVQQYKRAAERAKSAGFVGIELHAANGYLIDQFLQSRTNHRTDQYGGSIENRYRFLDEILDAVGDVYPEERIGVHISPNGNYADMGSVDFRETFLHVCKRLSERKLAYLHVLDGLTFGFHEFLPPMSIQEIRAAYEGPLIANCGYTKETAEAILLMKYADLVSFGRPYLANPDLVERFKNDWPLSPSISALNWYKGEEQGYLDQPRYKAAQPSAQKVG